MAEPPRRLVYRMHALRRMIERGISLAQVEAALAAGEVIAEYLDDEPYPSRLMLGWVEGRPFHLVVSDHPDGEWTIVITVYEPDALVWLPGYRQRK